MAGVLLLSSCAARPLTLEQAQEKVRRGNLPAERNKRYYTPAVFRPVRHRQP
jgi:hypothetical protein